MIRLGEEDVIERLRAVAGERDDVCLGIGDDGAILQPPEGRQLVSVMDTLNAGVHFPEDLPAAALAHRALAVNLSDLAAMGARPAWASLALSAPTIEAAWIESFVEGLDSLARQYDLSLVGGDTVRGPLAVTVHLTGFVKPGDALCRSGARPGDRIVVSGVPGEAAAGLARWRGSDPATEPLRQRFMWPQPRVELGESLAGIAHSAIDLSDGLVVDLGRMIDASGVGARVEVDRLPISPVAAAALGETEARRLALVGGDDYELCFTVAQDDVARLPELARAHACALTAIGKVVDAGGLEFLEGGVVTVPDLADRWRHFSEDAG